MTDGTEWHHAAPTNDAADEGQKGMPKGGTA
jgi:hypothetical protein